MDKKVYTTEADFSSMTHDKSDADEYIDFSELLFAKDWGKIPDAKDTMLSLMRNFHQYLYENYPHLTGTGNVSVKTPDRMKLHRLWVAIETLAYAPSDVHKEVSEALQNDTMKELSSEYSKKLLREDEL